MDHTGARVGASPLPQRRAAQLPSLSSMRSGFAMRRRLGGSPHAVEAKRSSTAGEPSTPTEAPMDGGVPPF
jgi:hypothetical protein